MLELVLFGCETARLYVAVASEATGLFQVKLFDYNWGQVSSVRVPFYVTRDCGYKDGDDLANMKLQPQHDTPYHLQRCRTGDNIRKFQGGFGDKVHLLPVKTLKTIMAELGHTYIDILKLDVEGSEYGFLEAALDQFDCPPVEQMSIEWHHFVFDKRYGGLLDYLLFEMCGRTR